MDTENQVAPVATDTEKTELQNNYYKTMLRSALASAGGVAGIVIAVKRKSGFWGGVGWFILGGMAGGAAGLLVGTIADGKPKV